MVLRKSLFACSLMLAALPLSAQTARQKDEFRQLCERLEPVSAAELAHAMGGYRDAMERRDGLTSAHLRAARFQDMEPLLRRAAEKGWGVLELFTQPGLSDPGGCALFMDEATLMDIHRAFDLHGVWQIAARPAGAKQASLTMRYLIVGRGFLLVGYPHAATVVIEDGDAVNGEYEYAPYFSARIIGTPAERGVVDIRALSGPQDEFSAFIGPYGVRIKAMRLAEGTVRVTYSFGLEQERRARNVPISVRNRVSNLPLGTSAAH